MTFDFDKAYAAFASQPAVQQFLNMNKDQLIALTEQQIIAVVMAYVTGGDATAAITSALSLPQQGAAIVTNTADIAQRRYDAGQRFLAAGKIALGILVSIIEAGLIL